MPYFTTDDGTRLFYRLYEPSQLVKPFGRTSVQGTSSLPGLVFIHGWPMSSSMFESHMVVLCETYGIHCVASDRRGFGKSDLGSNDFNYDTFASDTVAMLRHVFMKDFVFVCASMGCGEALKAYFQDSYVQKHCKGFVFVGTSLPYPLKTPENPAAPSRETWDFIVESFRSERASFVHNALPGMLGTDGAPKEIEHFERIVAQADSLAIERCVELVASTDFTPDLKAIAQVGLPMLVLHGDADSSVPAEASAKRIVELVPGSELKIYEKGHHGIYFSHREKLVQDIVDFLGAALN